MKTWQAILLHLGLAFGAAVVPTIKNQTAQAAAGVFIAAATAAVAQKNSNTNPDATPAEVAFTKKP